MSDNKLELPSTHTPEEQQSLREFLNKSNMDALYTKVSDKKIKYTEARLAMCSPDWWDENERLLKLSEDDPAYDKDMKKMAVQEINKVQLRYIDTTVKHDIGDITVNIINYKDQAIPENLEAKDIPLDDKDTPIEGEFEEEKKKEEPITKDKEKTTDNKVNTTPHDK